MPTMIDREGVGKLLQQGGAVVEVLPEKEYRKVHIAGAINLPLQKLNSETAKQLHREDAVALYCYDYQ